MLIQYPECIPEIDKRIIICDWEYDTTGKSFPNVNYFLGQGFSVITAPAVQNPQKPYFVLNMRNLSPILPSLITMQRKRDAQAQFAPIG